MEETTKEEIAKEAKGFLLWLKAAGIRAAKTAAEVLIILLGSNVANITDFDWPYILGAMAWGAVLAVAFSVKGLPEVEGGASLPNISKGQGGE